MHSIDKWEDCYPSNWKGIIVPEAMAHPAKYSSKLIRHIYEHLLAVGWVKPGDRVLDPFGGAALGALDAMRLGLNWYGMELEEKYHELGQAEYPCPGFTVEAWKRYNARPKMVQLWRGYRDMCPTCETAWKQYGTERNKAGRIVKQSIPFHEPHVFQGNIPLWMDKFASMPGFGTARLFHGDSRHLLEVLKEHVQVSVSSPPFVDSLSTDLLNKDERVQRARELGISDAAKVSPIDMEKIGMRHQSGYGSTPGQLGGMPANQFNVALSSPPYKETRIGGIDSMRRTNDKNGDYGSTPGQLGEMKAQGFEVSISSPPFLQSEGGTPEPKPGGAIDAALYARHAAGNKSADGYGKSDGQLSSMKEGSGSFEAAISSPPFGTQQTGQGIAAGMRGESDYPLPNNHTGKHGYQDQVATSGNLADMRTDNFQVAVSSPPYADSDQNYKEGWKRFHDGHVPLHANDIQREAEYGSTDGQLSAMPAASFDASISSPPYDAARVGQKSGQEQYGHGDQYGATEGQLGGADDFWLAARQIVEQVYMALAPGGHAVWVCKDYVKAKKIVPFSDQWRQLCEAVGFVTIHEHHAMLVHHKGSQHTLDGGMVEHKTESKSFFRRLSEKRGSPPINYEVIYCMVKE